MGVETKIEWCHHTWSPWHGCQKVSRGCTNCYAETMSKRNPSILGVWGPNGTRVISKSWDKPLAMDRAAAKAGERRRNFPSVCDWLEDRPELDEPRARLLGLIDATPNLDWLLLSKRPENFWPLMARLRECLEGDIHAQAWYAGNPPPNVWIGVSVEDQETADARIPALLEIPAALRWVSYEPALGPVDFRHWLNPHRHVLPDTFGLSPPPPSINWTVCGGESGHNARPFDIQWARETVRQCRETDVPVFVKQLGRRPIDMKCPSLEYWEPVAIDLFDPRGGAMIEWPVDLRVREMPLTKER